MYQHGTWSPYTGSGSLVLAVVMFIITGVLIYVAMRMRHPRGVKRPGAFVSILLIVIWVLSVLAFLIGSGAYALALSQQVQVSDLTPSEPHNSCNDVGSGAGLSRDPCHGATGRAQSRVSECPGWDDSCADDLRVSIRYHCDVAHLSSPSWSVVYVDLLCTALSY